MWLRVAIVLVCGSALAQQSQPPSNEPLPPGVVRIGNGVSPPRLIQKVEPFYSEEARRAALEGTVVLGMIVGADGKPRDFNVTRSLGLGLDAKAIEAVSAWHFQPSMREGNAVAVKATVEVNFRLLDSKSEPVAWHLTRAVFNLSEGASRPVVVKAKYPRGPDYENGAAVTVSFDVDEHGVPVHFHVDKSSGAKSEREMIAAAREWRFDPGLKGGKPVSVSCTFDFLHGHQ
jgi:TonB family protein